MKEKFNDCPTGYSGIIGRCDAMQLLFRRIQKVAPTTATVLVQGESGTGKELVAQAIHDNSNRSDGPMISVNCAAIPETLIESELFGHEKGAFTGANSNRVGLVEAANGGTLFLDEIGELPLEAQARLLRVLQENEIRKVGSVQTKKVDVRLIAATHRHLSKLSAEKTFREDLYYRLKVIELRIPALRERGKDLFLLAEKLLHRVCKKMQCDLHTFSSEAHEAMASHRWPGNVRELENALERAVILSDGLIITPEDLDLNPQHTTTVVNDTSLPEQTEVSLAEYFKQFVLKNQQMMTETELAKRLGISRKTLWEKRQKLGLVRRIKA